MVRSAALLAALAFPLAAPSSPAVLRGTVTEQGSPDGLPGVNVTLDGTRLGAVTDANGHYTITGIPAGRYTVRFVYVGYETKVARNVAIANTTRLDAALTSAAPANEEIMVQAERPTVQADATTSRSAPSIYGSNAPAAYVPAPGVLAPGAPPTRVAPNHPTPTGEAFRYPRPNPSGEDYRAYTDRSFASPLDRPLSTFAVDVDRASYANVRRFLTQGYAPPRDAVRIEEMVNYFAYTYPGPSGQAPLAVYTEVGAAPWAAQHRLVRVGLQARRVERGEAPPSNLVFLLDVSGSMSDANKLPLVQQAFRMLVNQLRPQDRVAIVVYAGAAGLVLPSTSGENKQAMLDALDQLQAGGSTAGGAGIQLAYDVARQHFIPGGNNRVILATDGDFNVGLSSEADLVHLIESRRDEGTYLTVLGVGEGNYQDREMEALSNKGNGNYAYLDNATEAHKALVTEMNGTLVTVAKDVKVQVEFNPARVAAYRLVGYENRDLEDWEFNDDRRDGGEVGAGHTVTALYEVVPVGVPLPSERGVDALRYQRPVPTPRSAGESDELLFVKVRYQPPQGGRSTLLTHPVMDRPQSLSDDGRFAAAVAAFGMLLRQSPHQGSATANLVLNLARSSRGRDADGYRAEFIRLVETWQSLGLETSARATD